MNNDSDEPLSLQVNIEEYHEVQMPKELDGPGEHWVSVDSHQDKLLIFLYDSFEGYMDIELSVMNGYYGDQGHDIGGEWEPDYWMDDYGYNWNTPEYHYEDWRD